jgi:hypothetical protein
MVVGRAVQKATGFDKDALNWSMKMSVSTTGPNSDFKQWKRNFLNFLSIKAAYLIPQLAIRESNAWLEEQAHHYAYTLLLHAAFDNKRDDHDLKCISRARPDCATVARDILCERLDCMSFARSLCLVDNLMLRQRRDQFLTDYVHFLMQTFDEYNKTCQLIDGYAAIHPHNLGLFMLRGISSSGPLGQASILHMAQTMDEDTTAPSMPAPDTSPPPISAFVAVGRGSHGNRGHNPRGLRGGRGLPNMCIACGGLDHIMSSCTTPDDALLKWTLAKRKMVVQKYGTPGGSASAHAALLSDVLIDETDSLPALEECTDKYDDTEVSVPFKSVAFSSSITHDRDHSQ